MAFFGSGDWVSQIVWFLLFFVFILIYPRMMIYQVVTKIQKNIDDLEKIADKGRQGILKKMSKKPTKELKDKVTNFMEFFVGTPVDLDPNGIVNKIHKVIKHANKRELQFVKRAAPGLSDSEIKDVSAAIQHNAGIYQIIKIIRHYLEIIKKYKILQIAMIIQMQLPIIKKIADALEKSVDAFVENAPIGDGIGPMIVASLIPSKKDVKVMDDEDFVYAKTNMEGRTVYLSKANGPGTTRSS